MSLLRDLERGVRGLFGDAELPERGTLHAKRGERPPQILKPAEPERSRAAPSFGGIAEIRDAVRRLHTQAYEIEALLPAEGEPTARAWEHLRDRWLRLGADCNATSARCRIGARRAHASLDGTLSTDVAPQDPAA